MQPFNVIIRIRCIVTSFTYSFLGQNNQSVELNSLELDFHKAVYISTIVTFHVNAPYSTNQVSPIDYINSYTLLLLTWNFHLRSNTPMNISGNSMAWCCTASFRDDPWKWEKKLPITFNTIKEDISKILYWRSIVTQISARTVEYFWKENPL